MISFRLFAVEIAELVSGDAPRLWSRIDERAELLFNFEKGDYPNRLSYDSSLLFRWLSTLFSQDITPMQKYHFTKQFCEPIVPDDRKAELQEILSRFEKEVEAELLDAHLVSQQLHPEVIAHCNTLFKQGNYFHALLEACKAYNSSVRVKARSSEDGSNLMQHVWSIDKGCLRLSPCQTDTEKSIQQGVQHLSAGLMSVGRNLTAHEPAMDVPIDKQGCVDLLGLVSFLFRQLDTAQYVPRP